MLIESAESKSMDERLKALKSLQQLICIAAAAVLAFAVTSDQTKQYQAALNEIEIFRKVDLKNYPVYVKRQFANEEARNRNLLIKAARQAHLVVRSSMAFSEPFVMDAPPLGPNIRLRDFDDFVTAQHTVGVCLLDDEQQIFTRLTEQLKQKPQQSFSVTTQPVPATVPPLTVTGIYANSGGSGGMMLNDVQMADPVVLHNSPNVESLQFLLYNGLPLPPSANFPVDCTFKPSDNLHLALDWLRSDENGKDLVDAKSGMVFPKLRPFWERIADMGADNAALFLQERIEAGTRGSLSLFGVSVDRDLVLFAGPAALLALTLFFWLHLRQVNDADEGGQREGQSSRDYPWVACFQGRLSGAVAYGCLVGLPVGSSLLLLFRHGELADKTTWLGAALTALLIVVAILTTISIHTFRKRL